MTSASPAEGELDPVALIRDLASELEGELDARYPVEYRVYPSEARRYERDMETVRRARAYLAASAEGHGIVEGWVLVPKEPTPEMLTDAGTMWGFMDGYQPVSMTTDQCHVEWWQAMLAAMPTSTTRD